MSGIVSNLYSPKAVDMIDADGNIVRSFNSVSEAAKIMRIPRIVITESCNGITNGAWKYHKEGPNDLVDKI